MRPRLGRGPDIHPKDMPYWGLLPLWGVGVWAWVHAFLYPYWHVIGADSIAYYVTRHHESNLYWLPPLTDGAYLYSPAFAQAIWPFTWLPWSMFAALWAVMEAAVLAWLLAPLGWRWGPPLLLLACGIEIPLGNIFPLLALSVAVGMRRPAAWAFPLLTKVTPGVGLLWFAVRREWRAMVVAFLTTSAIVMISWLIAPHQWDEWISFLRHDDQAGKTFAYGRYALAALITIRAAWRGKAWMLPVAMALATPVSTPAALVLLTAIPRLTSMRFERKGGLGAMTAVEGAQPGYRRQ